VHTTWIFVLLSEIIAIVIGLMAGVIPARHAARLDRAVHGSYLPGAAILITSLVNAIQK